MFELAIAFLHAIEQSVRDAALHTVELVLVGGVGQIHVTVSFPQQLLLVKFLYVRPFLFHLFHFLALGLFRGHTYRHDALYTGLRFFETYPEARLEASPLPVHFRTGIFIVEEVIVPVRGEVPRAVLHRLPLFRLLVVTGRPLGIACKRKSYKHYSNNDLSNLHILVSIC